MAGLTLMWALLLLAGAWRWRPAPARLQAFVPGPVAGRRRVEPWSPGDLAGRLGGALRRRIGRPDDAVLDRRLGWALVVAVAAGLVSPMLLSLGVAAWGVGWWRTARVRRVREQRVLDDHPDVVDLFLLAVDGGCNPRLAVEAVASWTTGPWGEALHAVVQRTSQGERLGAALDSLTSRLGDPARPLVVALLDAEHYGVALGPSLERLSAESAVARRRRAEERARRVPVQLLFPLVFCTLPAFVLLTVVPLLAGTLPTLSS